MNPLNNVITTVSVAGKEISFFKLELVQEFNNHHKLEVTVDFDQLESLWMNNLVSLINKIGEPIMVTMTHRQTGEANIFGGVITNIAAIGQHGEQNYYRITGMSSSIKLEGHPAMDSFVDRSLQDIVDEICSTSGNGAVVKNKPVFKDIIKYFCQYNESAFQVLNRLSWVYNEWFFNDGNHTYFGKPETIDEVELTYDLEIQHFNLSANLVPAKFNKFAYMEHRPLDISQPAPANLNEVRGFMQAALNQSNKLYTSEAFAPLDAPVTDIDQLEGLIASDKARAISKMLIFEGKSVSSRVKIGRYVQLLLPSTMRVDKMVEKFLVTRVVHTVDQAGRYENSFSGIPARIRSIPMQEPVIPRIGPQLATVTHSVGEGRIKVQTQWQGMLEKTTNWIRVQSPNAGVSDRVRTNRGMVFVPEVGDQVMIGFEYSDPSRPFVHGSMFPEGHTRGAGANNEIKSITTRSGIKIEFNDDKHSLYIEDPSGNKIDLDGSGNICITAPHQITLNAENIALNAGNSISTNAGNTVGLKAGKQIYTHSGFLNQFVSQSWALQANRSSINTLNKLSIESPTMILASADKLTLHSDNSILTNSLNSIELKAQNSIQSSQESEQHNYITQMNATVVEFRPSADFDSAYGFDWFRVGDIGDLPFSMILSLANVYQKQTNKVIKIEDKGLAMQRLIETEYPDRYPIVGTDLEYYVPMLNFYSQGALAEFAHLPADQRPTNVAKLRTLVSINSPISYIEFTYDKTLFSLSHEILTDNQVCNKKTAQEGDLTITCIDPTQGFDGPQYITAWEMVDQYTEPRIIGSLKIMPNAPEYRKKHKILIVPIATDIFNKQKIKTGTYKSDEINYLYKYLYQAFVEADLTIYNGLLNLADDENFQKKPDPKKPNAYKYGKYIFEKGVDPLKPGLTSDDVTDGYIYAGRIENGIFSIYPYLRKKFFKARQGNEDLYKDHTIIYIFDEKGYIYSEKEIMTERGPVLNTTFSEGVTEDLGRKNIIMYTRFSLDSLAHEVLHGLGLTHSFDLNRIWQNRFSFLQSFTDNVMDYHNDRKHTYRWQWKIVNEKLR